MLTLDPKIDLSHAKTVRLAGEDYFLAPPVLRQTVKIGALVPSFMQIFSRRGLPRRPDAENLRPDGDGDGSIEMAALSEDEMAIAVKMVAAGLSSRLSRRVAGRALRHADHRGRDIGGCEGRHAAAHPHSTRCASRRRGAGELGSRRRVPVSPQRQ